MKKKKISCITALGFCLFLGLMLLLFLLLPKREFSQNEKRYLAEAPALRWDTLLSGRFAQQAESWAADHLPGRDFFVGLNARYDLLSGRQGTKDIYVGRSGRLYEAPVEKNEAHIGAQMQTLNAFAAAIGRPLDFALIPSAGYILREDMPPLSDPYIDDAIIAEACAQAGEAVLTLDLLSVFEAEEDRARLYYRTDHHWTAAGAQLASVSYLEGKGREAPGEAAYAVREIPGFYGSTYARAALWRTPSESLELWDSGRRFLVENREDEEIRESLYYEEHLTENDKYPVYLDGNHSLVRIRNLDGGGRGKLLVVRDSFASCMGCFLAEGYEETVLVDLRYYRLPVSELVRGESFDDVLVIYSVGNFMTDSSLSRLE